MKTRQSLICLLLSLLMLSGMIPAYAVETNETGTIEMREVGFDIAELALEKTWIFLHGKTSLLRLT